MEKVSHFVEDRVLSDWETELSPPLLLFSIGLWKVASALWKARVLPAEAPFHAVCECVWVLARGRLPARRL